MIALASDHAGLPLKQDIMTMLDEQGIAYEDFGAYTQESCDYGVLSQKACDAVVSGRCARALLFCGTGIGISIAANKVRGIRCASVSDCYSAKMSRQHNNANALALGSRVVGTELARMIVTTWLSADFEGDRHQRRVDQIMAIEQGKKLYD